MGVVESSGSQAARQITIAPGAAADVAEIAYLYGRGSGRHADAIRIARNMRLFPSFVARSLDSTMVGFVFTVDFAPDVLELANIFVLPANRSRGLGASLIRRVEAAARSRGFVCIILVNSMLYPATYEKRPATELYRRLGYDILVDTGPSKIFSKRL